MSISERRDRQRAEREARIVAAARAIAESEGWPAVTIRRLADEIEYSQPVLYSHFANRTAIVAAVAVQGFGELATLLQKAARRGADPAGAIEKVAGAYLRFAAASPALYEAMFNLPTDLEFASAGTKPELRAAFQALAGVVAPLHEDGDTATETFWASLHGLAALEGAGRLRPSAKAARLAWLVRAVQR